LNKIGKNTQKKHKKSKQTGKKNVHKGSGETSAAKTTNRYA
jgi:hypothetical protein